MSDRVVYFARMCSPQGEIKIGISTDVKQRMNALRTSSPYEIEVLATRPGGLREEAAMHRMFDSLRLRGEWFRAGPELLAYLQNLPDVLPQYHGPLRSNEKVKRALQYARHVQKSELAERTERIKRENKARYEAWLAEQEAGA